MSLITTLLKDTLYRNLIVFYILLEFIILPSFNSSILFRSTTTSKTLFFLYGCLLIFFSYSTYLIVSRKIVFYLSKIDILLATLIIYFILNRYIIQSDYGFSLRYIELLGMCIMYIVMRSIPYKQYIWILIAIVISGLVQSVYGNLQFFGYFSSHHSGFRMTGNFFNPGPYAGFLVIVWTISLGIYLFKDKLFNQFKSQLNIGLENFKPLFKFTLEYISLIGIIIILFTITSLQSRASWLSLLITGGLLFEIRYSFIRNTFKNAGMIKRKIIIIITVIFISAVFIGLYHLKKGSADGRLFVWKVTSEIIKDSPIFGVGFDRFKADYMNYQITYFKEKGETFEAMVASNTIHAFNEWLQFIVENGFIGFILLILILITLYKLKVKKENKHIFIIAKAGLIYIGVFAFFSYPMQILPIKLIMVFLLSLIASLDINTYRIRIFHKKEFININAVLKSFLLFASLFIVAQGFIKIREMNQAFIVWKNALTIYEHGDYAGAIKEYETTYFYFKNDGEFLMNYGKTLSVLKKHKKAIQILEQGEKLLNITITQIALGDSYKALSQYEKAEKAYKKASNMIPNRFYPKYLLAKLYVETGEQKKASSMAKEILNKKIKINSTAIKEMKIEMKKLLYNIQKQTKPPDV